MSEIQRTLEVAASARILQYRRRRALEDSCERVVLGRHFVTLRGLAEACVAETGIALRGELAGPALARVVRHCARRISALAALVDTQPGAIRALAGTLRDLRDAGVSPDALPASLRPLRELYTSVERSLVQLEQEGLFDRISLFRLARRGAADWLRRLAFTRVDVYGATELVGSAGDLIETIAEIVPLCVHQPDWDAPYTRELRESVPWSFPMQPEPVVDEPVLRSEVPASDDVLRCTQTPGPREELEVVAQQILERLEAGAVPSKICVVARSLEPYAPWLEPVFGSYGIPFTSSLGEPVLRHPRVRARLDLARALGRRLEREPTLALLRSPYLHWKRFRAAEGSRARVPLLAESLARMGRVRRSGDWLTALADANSLLDELFPKPEPENLKLLERILRELDEDRVRFSSATSWEERVRALADAEARWLEDAEVESLSETALQRLRWLDRIDQLCGWHEQPSDEEFVSALEGTLRDTRQRPGQVAQAGVWVLDALQARAFPTQHLFLLGLNHESWPLELREDPFLPGWVREQVRSKTRRPLPVPHLQQEEDRFLLGLLLSQATQSVSLSWHERDAAGRARAASMYLHELPFVSPATSGLERAKSARKKLSEKFLSSNAALQQAALTLGASQGEAALLALARALTPEQVDPLSAGLELVRLSEARAPGDLRYDGVLGAESLELPKTFSPSFLERLGQCPQRAFFNSLLRVRELHTPPIHEFDSREAGNVLHRVLRVIYGALFASKQLGPGQSAERALEKARGLLPDVLAAEAGPLRSHLLARQGAVWDALERQLGEATLDLLRRDLDRLLPEGITGLELEKELEFTRICDGEELRVRGKADRILELVSGELRVGDYKTRMDPKEFLSPRAIEQGTALQIPLYVLGVGARHPGRAVMGEVLAVPLRPERDREGTRARPHMRALEEVEAKASPALATLSRLLREGHFPFRRNPQCHHCPYVVACRKAHPPSEERVRTAAPFREYFALHGEGA